MEDTPRQAKGRLLCVDDDGDILKALTALAQSFGYAVDSAPSGAEALELVAEHDYDVVLTDLRMPGMDGMELMQRLHETQERLIVVMCTGYGSVEVAVKAIKAGAYDFVIKPFDVDQLEIVLGRAVTHRRLTDQVSQRQEEEQRSHRFGRLLGRSEPMRRLYDLITRLAPSKSHVLLTGESGTGKDLVAREIHARSPRVERAFVPVSCAAIPDDLLESELFGHAKGAFTDAIADRKGLFERASGGTIFLDEITEMSTHLQAKLLRALQDGEVRRIGADDPVIVDARVIAASNRKVEEAVKAETFREDLYYRLNVIRIEMPPLRERSRDIPLLAKHFAEKYSEEHGRQVRDFSVAAMRALCSYDWPGNVRELENVVERAVVLSRDEVVRLEDLPMQFLTVAAWRAASNAAEEAPTEEGYVPASLAEVERQHIQHVLQWTHEDKQAAAKCLGIGRATLYRKLAQMGG